MDERAKFGLWSGIPVDWFASRQAAKLFFIATFFVCLLTAALPALSRIDVSQVTAWQRITGGILGVGSGAGSIFIWFGMWRYWARLDNSETTTKQLWFVVLLVGFWYGGCLYFYFVYLPQVRRRWKAAR